MSDIIMKRKYKQRWSIFQLTSTKRKITSHLNWLTTKNVGNHVKFELNNYGFDISTDCRWFRFKTQTGLQLNLVFITIGLNYHIEKNGTSAVSVRCSTQSTHCATNCSFVWKWNKTVWPNDKYFSFGHCIVCTSSIYGFWLFHWYLQILLTWNKQTSINIK